ncbi:MAG: hypothetical protein AABW45_03020 [Nanoarchaeota archaeon]
MKIKYPKLLLFLIAIIGAYYFYKGTLSYDPPYDLLINLGYVGAFFAGILFSYGFTSPFAVAIFLILSNNYNAILLALIGGVGAFLSDFTIFKLLKFQFSDEIKNLKNEKIILWVDKKLPRIIKAYLIPVLAGFIIASPLPDEIGISLLAFSKISSINFFMLSYILNTLGIFIIIELRLLI